MSELDDIKAAKAERMRGHDEPKMESACWEYACPCHDDLDRAIAIAEQIMQMKMPLKLYAMGLEAERDEARADVLKMRDAWGGPISLEYNSTNTNKAKHKVWAETESYEQYR